MSENPNQPTPSGDRAGNDKSGVSEQVLSLPSGGGALEGTGGKFATRRQTGAGGFSLPVEVPDGRDGFQPDLQLTYSTGNGEGAFGLGWALGVPTIGRKTEDGVPVYDDAEDTFLLSGAEDLVAVERRTADDGTSITSYRPRTERSFDRIERHHGETTDHWTVEGTDGTVRRYGTPGAAGADPAAVADPDDRSKVFRWQLTETVDPFGNRIEYEYARDASETGPHHWDELYLDRIKYVDYEDDAGRTEFLVTVEFEYDDRPEPISRYRSGFEVRTRKRCSRIVVRTHADRDRPIRSYELTYRDEVPDEDGPANGTSQLARVQVVGHDDGDAERLPPVEFDYAGFDPGSREFEALEGPLPRRSLAAPELELADLSGDGLPDVVEIDGSIRYWRNLGGGEFDDPRPMAGSPAGLSLADPGVQLMDADGDGRIDLATFDAPSSGYFPLERDGGWSDDSFQPYDRVPAVDLDAPNVRMVDLDGNGVTDVVRSGSSLACFFQDAEGGWTDARTASGALDGIGELDFADPRMRLADLTGDGLQDVVMIDDGHVSYWPNRGYGDWGRRVRTRNPPDLPWDHDPGRVLLGDVDGDGLADVLHVEDDRVTLWLNRCGNGWSDPIVVEGTPSVTDTDAIRLVDVEGDGIGGLLYSGGGRPGDDEMYFLDFTDDLKPYLMTEVRNNMGARTRIDYAPSTAFYLQDGGGWKTTLPNPTWVVSRVESIDEISGGKLATEYTYHHGYWDGAEREFRGFGLVEQRDTESFEDYDEELHGDRASSTVGDRERFSPPTLTKTWFHLGPVGPEHGDWRELDYGDEFWDGDPPTFDRPGGTRRLLERLPRREKRDAIRSLRGRTLRTEVYALDGSDREDRPHTVSERHFGIREESPSGAVRSDSHPVFFPHRVRSRETAWERGTDPRTRITVTDEYDRYGQPLNRIEIAPPRDWRPGTSTDEYLVTQGRTAYAYRDDETRYVADRVAEETKYEVRPLRERTVEELLAAIDRDDVDRRLIGLSRHYYDGEAFSGLDLGEVGEYGARVRTEELTLTDEVIAEAYPRGTDPPDDFAEEYPPGIDPPGDSGASPYLMVDAPSWPEEYPTGFREQVPERAGYAVSEDLPDAASADVGYFSVSHQVAYDFQRRDGSTGRGLLSAKRDPLDNETTITRYDAYDLNPTEVAGPSGLVREAEYDYAAMKPRQVTDPNGNRTRTGYTPLGMVASVAKLGSADREEGDTPEQPGKRFLYDLRAFERSPPDDLEPAYVHTVERERHRWDVVERERDRRGSEPDEEELFPRDPDADVPERPEIERYPERFVQSREYSDGFGRLVQVQVQAEDRVFGEDETFGNEVLSPDQSVDATGPVHVHEVGEDEHRVRVSGWKTYDNKGNVVERYEPFFLVRDGWEYLSRREAARSRRETFGQHAETFYDALGRETRTVNPDGSESRIVRGTFPAGRIDDPDAHEPTPWETYEYDANDNAGRTHGADAADYDHHWNTPTSRRFDALDREVETVERNRTADGGGIERHRTGREYDVRGNVVSITDPLGRGTFAYSYDLADDRIRTYDADGGTRRLVLDAAGNELERRDAKGALELQRYDASNRATHEWARDGEGGDVTLRRRVFYAETDDALPEADARARNLLGSVHRSYDEAGRLRFEAHDFKDNPLRKERRVLDDDAVKKPPIDWGADGGPADRETALLASGTFRTEMAYDALDRVTRTRYPEDGDGDRKELRREYTRGGELRRVELATGPDDDRPETYVADVGYDATGERTFVAYGNGVMTRYAYDDSTKRLKRQLTQPYERTGSGGYVPDREAATTVLQDFGYEYDLAGNVRTLRDGTPNSGVKDAGRGADELHREFEYDALNRLTKATGREASDVPSPRPWADTAPTTADEQRYGVPDVTRQNAPHHTVLYQEEYEYDAAGNMTEMHHEGAADWTRNFGVGGSAAGDWTDDGWTATPSSNRVTHVRDRPGLSRPTHEYDDAGNLLRERNSNFAWDHADRLRSYEETAQDGTTSVGASYAYDPGGRRVKKVVDKGGRTDVTVYVDGIFEYRRREFESPGRERRSNATLHVMDDETRVALVRVGDPLDEDDPTPAVRYQHGDHLDSSTLVVDDQGGWIDYEEFTPFGETAFGGYASKRYRFAGEERDEESGLYYHGARYYAPWLCRWTTTDPAGRVDGPNLYRYVSNNPLAASDPTGTQERNETESDESDGQALENPGSGDTVRESKRNYNEMIDRGDVKIDGEPAEKYDLGSDGGGTDETGQSNRGSSGADESEQSDQGSGGADETGQEEQSDVQRRIEREREKIDDMEDRVEKLENDEEAIEDVLEFVERAEDAKRENHKRRRDRGLTMFGIGPPGEGFEVLGDALEGTEAAIDSDSTLKQVGGWVALIGSPVWVGPGVYFAQGYEMGKAWIMTTRDVFVREPGELTHAQEQKVQRIKKQAKKAKQQIEQRKQELEGKIDESRSRIETLKRMADDPSSTLRFFAPAP